MDLCFSLGFRDYTIDFGQAMQQIYDSTRWLVTNTQSVMSMNKF